MRRGAMIAAICGLGCSSAQAQQTITTSTILYSDSEQPFLAQGVLQPFNSSLGVLTGVSLDITTASDTAYVFAAPGLTSIDVSTVGTFTALVNGVSYSVPISGSETATISSVFTTDLHDTGSATFTLDPSLFGSFVDTANKCGFAGVGVCVSNGFPSVTFSPTPAGLLNWGETDYLDNTTYKLTYTYELRSDVPEARTWIMMLLGLAAIGLSLRRRTAVDATVRLSRSH